MSVVVLLMMLCAQGTLFAGTILKQAVFAGGCFWCTQSDFEKVDGVIQVLFGYMGGKGASPDYIDYAQKGYIEVVQVTYDPSKISYAHLLDVFWHHVDPADAGGQFVDRGPQYRAAVFYMDEEQKKLAEESKKVLQGSGVFDKPIVTEIIPASTFYKAKDYHQDYYKTSVKIQVLPVQLGARPVFERSVGR